MTLCTSVGPSTTLMMGAISHMPAKGISLETPSAPWACIERHTASWTTLGVRALMAAMFLRVRW